MKKAKRKAIYKSTIKQLFNGLSKKVKCTLKVGQVKHYPVIERVRYWTGLFSFNRDLIHFIIISIYYFKAF